MTADQIVEGDDIWATILSMTRKTAANRRKSIDPPKTNAPNPWIDCNKHAAIGNLLSIAVSHKDLKLRKAYIERIMTLSPTTQRLLMSMIEKRKRANGKKKTPSKKSKKRAKESTPGKSPAVAKTNSDKKQSKSPYERDTTSPVGPKDDKYMHVKKRNNPADEIQTKKEQLSQSPACMRESSSLSPNISRYSPSEMESQEKYRRNFHDAFGSPMQQPLAKRVPPPSSERHRKGQTVGRTIFSPGLGDTAEYESQVQALRDENEELARELKKSRQKEEEFSRKLDDLDENKRKEMLKVEREAREREDKTREEYELQISEIRAQLTEVTDECNSACSERDELTKIKDEMEVLSHNKMLFEETTERLRTYKEKVQQFTDVKDALQREEEAHSRSVEENLRLKNELKSLQPLKKQLEDYKKRVVDAEVRLTDCQDELNKLKEQKVASSTVNTEMEQYVIAQETEIKELRRRVQQNDAAKEDGSGIGDGMSELNPELKKEILSLRNENQQLRAFAEKRQEDEVSKLEQNAEDKNMLAERYKDQFLLTKDKLESTEISLADSKNRETKLQEEVRNTTKLVEGYKSQAMSTKSQLESTQLSLQDSKTREGSLRSELADSLKKIKSIQIEVEDISKQLNKSREDLKAGVDRESNLEKELASWTREAKDMQERSNDLSRNLATKEKDLEDITKKERILSEEISKVKNDNHLLQERCSGLADELQHCTVELEQSHCRESRLEINVKEWMERVQESDKHTARITLNLEQHTEELKKSMEVIENLETKEAESSSLMVEAEREIEKLSNELNDNKLSLEKTRKSLEQNMQRYLDLQSSLADMSSRAEDAESISANRLELLQSTREELKDTKQEIETLAKEKESLVASVEKWTSQTEKVRSTNEALEKKLEEKHDELNNAENRLAEAQREISALSKEKCLAEPLKRELEETKCSMKNIEDKLSQSVVLNNHRTNEIEILTSENENLKNKISNDECEIASLRGDLIKITDALRLSQETIEKEEEKYLLSSKSLQDAENSVINLQNELLETKQNLKATQETAEAMKESERLSNDQLQHAEQMLSELEDSVEKEVQANEKISITLEKCEAEKLKMKGDFDSREEKLLKSLESEKEKGNKLKQELGEVKNELSTLQDSLSSLQHREKMLQHEATKLEDKKRECENELSTLKSSTDEALEQSSKSLEAVREMMTAKSQKELEELQQSMNQLLEDERKAKRQQDVLYKDQIAKLNEQHNEELLRLKDDNNSELQKYMEEKETESKQLNEEFMEKIKSLEMNAKEEKEKLMETGKGMMKEIREKKEKEIKELSDDVTFLEKKIIKEEDEKKRLGQQFQTKIIEYKKKLQVASGRINTLSADNNDFEDRVKYLEREKLKLREENDRYRRQLGGRSGADSALSNQLETLQSEFKNAIDENRELKRKLQGQGFSSLSSVGEESSSRPYTRNRANQSTLLQLRSEYEETIESLNDEKRELIMKNSAAITDVQKAEKRAWLVEQDNSILKQDLTSLKLSNERLENMLASFHQEHGITGHSSFTQNMHSSDDCEIPKPPTPEMISRFDDASSIGMASYQSQRRKSRDSGILGTNQGFTNRSGTHSNYGLTSPDLDTKRFVQSTTLHDPYRNQSLR